MYACVGARTYKPQIYDIFQYDMKVFNKIFKKIKLSTGFPFQPPAAKKIGFHPKR